MNALTLQNSSIKKNYNDYYPNLKEQNCPKTEIYYIQEIKEKLKRN